MFKFTGITKDAGCGKPQHSKAKVLMVAAKSKPKKKIIKEGNFAKGAFIGKAVTKIKKSLEAGKKARTYRKNLRSVSNTLNKQVDAARLPSGGWDPVKKWNIGKLEGKVKLSHIMKAAKATYHAPESARAQEIAFDHAMLPKKNYVYTDTTFTAGKPSAIKTIIGNKRGGKLKLEKLFKGKMQVDTHDMDKEELDRYTAQHMLGDS